MPRVPVRTISMLRPAVAATRIERRGDLVGADRKGRGVPRDEEPDRHAPASSSSASSFGAVSRPTSRPSSIADGAGRAQAEAVDRLERHAAVGGGAAAGDAEAILRPRHQRLAAHRLAGLGAAQLEHVTAGRLAAEVVIEGDDAVHLGARQIESIGEDRHHCRRHVAERGLHPMQDLDQRIGPVAVLSRQGAGDVFCCYCHRSPHLSRSEAHYPPAATTFSNR